MTPKPQVTPATRARRAPVQDRSAGTVQRIYEATTRLLADGTSVDDLTTSQIAMRATVSVGSLYRFFPDKQAIVDALAVHRLHELEDCVDREVTSVLSSLDGQTFLSRVIDVLEAFLERNRDFSMLAYGGYVSPAVREASFSNEIGLPRLLKAFLIDVLGYEDNPRLDLRLRVANEASHRVVAFALTLPDTADRVAVFQELKTLMTSYLIA